MNPVDFVKHRLEQALKQLHPHAALSWSPWVRGPWLGLAPIGVTGAITVCDDGAVTLTLSTCVPLAAPARRFEMADPAFEAGVAECLGGIVPGFPERWL